jgi:3-phosphoshikimate 1-carboxyvinyltransferase
VAELWVLLEGSGMELVAEQSALRGTVEIPASKSHTIRAVAIASLADGVSEIINPLVSEDSDAAVAACRALGARVEQGERWVVTGTGGRVSTPEDVVNMMNSGTSTRMALGMASLGTGYAVFTGDASLRTRPMGSLLEALARLGATAFSTRGDGRLPAVVRGPIRGGETAVEGTTSQYVSSLLICTPLAERDTQISVANLRERPYVEMTMRWLDSQRIRYLNDNFEMFVVEGRQAYHPFVRSVPGDFSSATFFLCAAAITDSDLTLVGLDMEDVQGDKRVVDMLRAMGARITVQETGLRVQGGDLRGTELDLNDTPDALPSLAVVGCCARGETRLVNVPQARIKETDRIAALRQELGKMGADVEELPDGLILRRSSLRGARVDGRGDHRVVMALALAGLVAQGTTRVTTAEAIRVTFPNYVELMAQSGARMRLTSP